MTHATAMNRDQTLMRAGFALLLACLTVVLGITAARADDPEPEPAPGLMCPDESWEGWNEPAEDMAGHIDPDCAPPALREDWEDVVFGGAGALEVGETTTETTTEEPPLTELPPVTIQLTEAQLSQIKDATTGHFWLLGVLAVVNTATCIVILARGPRHG